MSEEKIVTEVTEEIAEAVEAPVAEEKAEEAPAQTMADFEDQLDENNFEAPIWNGFKELMEKKETIEVKVENAVKGGAIAFIDGIRAFIPQSHLALGKAEEAASLAGKEIKVKVIEVEQASKKLILSAREVLREEARQAKRAAAEAIEIGSVLKGKVETLQPYGAFIRLENGLSGLVHVSQISNKRVNDPADVLKVEDEVQVKVINLKDGKLSLSMKALLEPVEKEEKKERPARAPREREEKIEIPKAENIATNLGDLLKNFKF